MKNPSWWSHHHESAWDRVKSALHRDWEQTKADVSTRGHELNQGVGDTVKQVVGKEPIPPGNLPNASFAAWDQVEPGYRFGVGARAQYGHEHASWNERVERKLADEWTTLEDGRRWADVKPHVRRGWEQQ
jgi:hypothetical protein